jgi:hypothetical protein
LLVHVLDPVVADVYIQLKGLKQGHHRRAVIIARPGGGVGGDHQALSGCLAQDSKPGGFPRRQAVRVFFDADDFHIGPLMTHCGPPSGRLDICDCQPGMAALASASAQDNWPGF